MIDPNCARSRARARARVCVRVQVPGTLPDAEDQPVILGNHRDAWVYGAADPNSGTANLLEVAKGLGVLLRSGWRPRRSIVLCSWSGEEGRVPDPSTWPTAPRRASPAGKAFALSGDLRWICDFMTLSATR